VKKKDRPRGCAVNRRGRENRSKKRSKGALKKKGSTSKAPEEREIRVGKKR